MLFSCLFIYFLSNNQSLTCVKQYIYIYKWYKIQTSKNTWLEHEKAIEQAFDNFDNICPNAFQALLS